MRRRRRKARRKGRKRGVYLSKKMGVEMTYRSGWELVYFQHLDSDENVKEFFSEPFKIPYVSNVRSKKLRNYIPDLLVVFVDGSRKLIEVKPTSKLDQPVNVKKFNAARQWCNDQATEFVLVTEVDLKRLGLL